MHGNHYIRQSPVMIAMFTLKSQLFPVIMVLMASSRGDEINEEAGELIDIFYNKYQITAELDLPLTPIYLSLQFTTHSNLPHTLIWHSPWQTWLPICSVNALFLLFPIPLQGNPLRLLRLLPIGYSWVQKDTKSYFSASGNGSSPYSSLPSWTKLDGWARSSMATSKN